MGFTYAPSLTHTNPSRTPSRVRALARVLRERGERKETIFIKGGDRIRTSFVESLYKLYLVVEIKGIVVKNSEKRKTGMKQKAFNQDSKWLAVTKAASQR